MLSNLFINTRRQACNTSFIAQGQPWTAALAGHDVDPIKQQEEQQRLMLERFQQEVITGIISNCRISLLIRCS